MSEQETAEVEGTAYQFSRKQNEDGSWSGGWERIMGCLSDAPSWKMQEAFTAYLRNIVRSEIERRFPLPGTRCAWCKAELPHSEDGAAAKEHVKSCVKSPSFALKNELDAMRADRDELRQIRDRFVREAEDLRARMATMQPKPNRKSTRK